MIIEFIIKILNLGLFLLKFDCIKNKYNKELKKELDKGNFIEKNKNNYKDMIDLNFQKNMTFNELKKLLDTYNMRVMKNTENKIFSGTIYRENKFPQKFYDDDSIENLYSYIMLLTSQWNQLHDSIFFVCNEINFQLVKIITELFGGDIKNTMGLVTNGGTQSIMTAARCYVNYGDSIFIKNKIIIAPKSIHASLIKASETYNFKLVLVNTKYGIVDENDLKQKIKKYKKNLVALFCSAPSYAYGIVDNIKLFSDLAKENKVGLHVDCCLGSFIINYISESDFLKFEGVSSISVDPHKNGLSPKDVSVLLCKNINDKNLLYYSIYAITNWEMLYGTPQESGSKGIVSSLCALVTLMYYGDEHYKKMAIEINDTVIKIIDWLDKTGDFDILTRTPVNVVSFKFKNKYSKGSSYLFSDLLKERGVEVNPLIDDSIHFCVTNRFCENKSYEKFINIFEECMKIIKDNREEIKSKTNKLYCSVEIAMNPQKGDENYYSNLLFGETMLKDIIKYHYLTMINPYYNFFNKN